MDASPEVVADKRRIPHGPYKGVSMFAHRDIQFPGHRCKTILERVQFHTQDTRSADPGRIDLRND